jgi:Leucine-rich repeat (LRR) protein
MKQPFDSDDIKNEILSGEESRIALAISRGRKFGFDADNFYAALIDVCNFLENKKRKLYSIPGLAKEISNNGLDISALNLTEIPTSFAVLNEMTKSADLSNNEFSEFPTAILGFVKIQKLNLSNNRLNKLPTGFVDYSNLEELDISGNLFTQLPELLTKMSSLRSLKLSCSNEIFFKGKDLKSIENLSINLDRKSTRLNSSH